MKMIRVRQTGTMGSTVTPAATAPAPSPLYDVGVVALGVAVMAGILVGEYYYDSAVIARGVRLGNSPYGGRRRSA